MDFISRTVESKLLTRFTKYIKSKLTFQRFSLMTPVRSYSDRFSNSPQNYSQESGTSQFEVVSDGYRLSIIKHELPTSDTVTITIS